LIAFKILASFVTIPHIPLIVFWTVLISQIQTAGSIAFEHKCTSVGFSSSSFTLI
jgi:hypothetical protein